LKDKELRKRFDAVATKLNRNAGLREFRDYMQNNEAFLSGLTNLKKFKEDVLKSYLKSNVQLYDDLMQQYSKAKQRKKEIEEEARKESTQWDAVIDMFNTRFFVPFPLRGQEQGRGDVGAEGNGGGRLHLSRRSRYSSNRRG